MPTPAGLLFQATSNQVIRSFNVKDTDISEGIYSWESGGNPKGNNKDTSF
jgi:hypothetical protein